MAKQDFLGTGWGLPITLDDQDKIVQSSNEDSIRQSIWMILATAPGERMMRPDFGCGIHDLVFAPNTPTTWGQVANYVRTALIRWEPRIDVEHVSASSDPTRPNCLLIQIVYRVRSTNTPFNLVFPFYLE